MSAALLTLPVTAAVLFSAAPVPSREVDNVAAFGRLYGVVRFFYPSDAAAELDWNRFAADGVKQVREARSTAELATTLERLVAPLGPGIEVETTLPPPAASGAPGQPLVAWRYLGAGFSTMGGAYHAKRTHRALNEGGESFVTLMQTVTAATLRGKGIRLRAQVRATATDASGAGALWLRVDRPNGVMGFFDNMGNRPIREPQWRAYTIEGTVAEDAENVAFGVMVMGSATVDFDAVELAVKGAAGDWTLVPIKDASFEETAADGAGAWLRTGPKNAILSRPDASAPEGRQFVRFAPPPAGAADDELFSEGAPSPGAHVDVDLGSGLRARVPLALTDADARTNAERATKVAAPNESPDLDQRLADVVVAWNVFRHFYPYWTEAGVDWDSRLVPQLEAARAAETREAQKDVLRRLVADVRDGHGFVADTLDKREQAQLPVELAVIQNRIVVTASSLTDVSVGAEVVTIDAAPAAERLARETSLISGTAQWRQWRAVESLLRGPKGGTIRLGLEANAGPKDVTLSYDASRPAATRPALVTEIEPGLWYVDLTRAKMAEIAPKLEGLAAARAVVFDMRGYPTDAAAAILPHLVEGPEHDRWMHVAKVVGPFFETAGWMHYGWDVSPQAPRIAGRIVVLTDGRAISYAESVMGYMADRKLGTIVGSATAGTNGNVATFVTPGGFSVRFTGMRVTRHDGSGQHHLVGVSPDVVATPTLEGFRAGRDEVLERGLAIAREAAGPRP